MAISFNDRSVVSFNDRLVIVPWFFRGINDQIPFIKRHNLLRVAVVDAWEWVESPFGRSRSPIRIPSHVLAMLRSRDEVHGLVAVQRAGLALNALRDPDAELAPFDANMITPDLATMLQPPMVAGRWFTSDDWSEDQEIVPVVVSARWAKSYPLGETFAIFLRGNMLQLQVVGIYRAASLYFAPRPITARQKLRHADSVDGINES